MGKWCAVRLIRSRAILTGTSPIMVTIHTATAAIRTCTVAPGVTGKFDVAFSSALSL